MLSDAEFFLLYVAFQIPLVTSGWVSILDFYVLLYNMSLDLLISLLVFQINLELTVRYSEFFQLQVEESYCARLT